MIPPRIIKSASSVITTPVTAKGTLNVEFNAVEIEFACVRLPIPKDAITAKRANSHPNKVPSFLFLKAFSLCT